MTKEIIFVMKYTGKFWEASVITEALLNIVDEKTIRVSIKKSPSAEFEYLGLYFDYHDETWEEEGYIGNFFIIFRLNDGTYNFRFQEECPFCKVD